jgi:hypothetical protein
MSLSQYFTYLLLSMICLSIIVYLISANDSIDAISTLSEIMILVE